MIHPHTELRLVDERIGHGVFATRFIPRGTLTWVLCQLDQIYTPEQVETLPAPYRRIMDTYAYINADGTWVLCWDWGRYMNHSCAPNTLGLGAYADVAVRDIQPGEQITCEYGMLNLTEGMPCHCGAPGCRGRVEGDDVLRCGEAWDAVVAQTAPLVALVAQPLRGFMQDPVFLDELAAGRAAPPKARSYFHAS
ncbi:MAG: SET domain-containing protein [Candidatus Latescibacteria bacterium]|nr:SET domain-containing protein [Candidatus Latescibacterota bacterium]